jgi:hypothetical protein
MKKVLVIDEYSRMPIIAKIRYMANRPTTRFTASTHRT